MSETSAKFETQITLSSRQDGRGKNSVSPFFVVYLPMDGQIFSQKFATLSNNIEDGFSYLQKAPKRYTGTLISEYVVQEKLIGEEYFVNTFSVKKEHKVISIYRYKKMIINGNPIYQYIENVHPNESEYHISAQYVINCLNAVGLYNGMGHTEIFLTSAGPSLVEVNPRIVGASGMLSQLSKHILESNQCEAFIHFLKKECLDIERPVPKMYGRLLIMHSWQHKEFQKFDVKKLKSLPSFYNVKVLKEAGAKIHPPRELSDAVAFVNIAYQHKRQLEKDCMQIFEWEQNNILF